MSTPKPHYDLIPLAPDAPFQFDCHFNVPCFNSCCRDLNQALTPYDVLMLRTHLGLPWRSFLEQFAHLGTGPSSGLPVVTMRFDQQEDKKCPFVTHNGCRVYTARPASCRLYPLMRAVQRTRNSGGLTESYALIREPHCRGFEAGPLRTVSQWIIDQQLDHYLAANDRLLELIALKNQYRRGVLPPSQHIWMVTALYDLDQLKTLAGQDRLASSGCPPVHPFPDAPDDRIWLEWGMAWVRQMLWEGPP